MDQYYLRAAMRVNGIQARWVEFAELAYTDILTQLRPIYVTQLLLPSVSRLLRT